MSADTSGSGPVGFGGGGGGAPSSAGAASSSVGSGGGSCFLRMPAARSSSTLATRNFAINEPGSSSPACSASHALISAPRSPAAALAASTTSTTSKRSNPEACASSGSRPYSSGAASETRNGRQEGVGGASGSSSAGGSAGGSWSAMLAGSWGRTTSVETVTLCAASIHQHPPRTRAKMVSDVLVSKPFRTTVPTALHCSLICTARPFAPVPPC